MTSSLEERTVARRRKRRRTPAGVGLVVLGAALGLIGGGLWLHARRKGPSRADSPFTLDADLQSGRAPVLRDESGVAPPRADHD